MANTIGTAYVQIEPSTKGISGSISKALDSEATAAGTSAGGKLSSALGAAAKVGVAAIAGATTAMVGFGASAVSAGKDFDSSMSQVAATMGFSKEQLNDSSSEAAQTFQQLRDFAQEMGSTTAFSATESAEALNYMALAGYDAETAMNTLPSVLNLAASGGIGLADASDMVTDALSAFGLDSEYAATMVDQMAKTASKSNTSVAQLGDAYLTIGANAKQLSGGTQELSTMLGVLADNGIKGSEAGTHLRNIILAMNPTTDKAANAWEKLGVSAYDAQGNLRPLEDTFADLNQAMEGMSDQEKTNMLTSMFNKTDLASINALLGTEATKFDELSTAIGNASGAAEDMAGVQLNNLEGDVTLFKSALEGLQIAVSDQVTPTLREFVSLGSDGIAEITGALKRGDIETAFQHFADYIEAFLNKILEKIPQVVSAAEKIVSALGEAFLNNIDTIVDAAIQIMVFLVEGLIGALPKLIDAAASIIIKLADAIVEALPTMIPQIVKIIEHIVEVLTENLPKLIEAATEIIVELANGLSESLPEMIPQIVDIILLIVDTLLDNLEPLIDAALKIIVAIAEGIIKSLPKLAEKVPQIIVKIIKVLTENFPDIIKTGGTILVELVKGLIGAIPELVKSIPDIVMAFIEGFDTMWDSIKDVGTDIVSGIWEGIKGEWGELCDSVVEMSKELVGRVKDFFSIGSPSKLMRDEVGKWIPEGMAIGIEANADSVTDAIDELNSDTLNASKEMVQDVTIARNYSGEQMEENNIVDGIYAMLRTYLPNMATTDNLKNLNFNVNEREFARLVNGVI